MLRLFHNSKCLEKSNTSILSMTLIQFALANCINVIER